MTDNRDDDLIRPPVPGPTRDEQVRATQRARARIMAIGLGLFVILVFAISIVRIQQGMHGQ